MPHVAVRYALNLTPLPRQPLPITSPINSIKHSRHGDTRHRTAVTATYSWKPDFLASPAAASGAGAFWPDSWRKSTSLTFSFSVSSESDVRPDAGWIERSAWGEIHAHFGKIHAYEYTRQSSYGHKMDTLRCRVLKPE